MPVGSFQNTRFTLAELATEVEIGQIFIDRCVEALNDGELTPEDAAMAKWWCTELQGRVVDRCLQLHGGYGYMSEYPIAKAYVDARVTTIYGGHDRDHEGDHRAVARPRVVALRRAPVRAGRGRPLYTPMAPVGPPARPVADRPERPPTDEVRA